MLPSSLPVKSKEQEKTPDVKSVKGESALRSYELFNPVAFSLFVGRLCLLLSLLMIVTYFPVS